jgi:drug/metabolite transporter (DMT)-like permease
LTVLIAVASSALFGSGVALQQRPARNVPESYAARFGLLARVAHRPLWLLGIGAEFAGFALQVVALGHGSLVVVQPIITVSLLFTIALASTWSRSSVTRRDWAGVVAVVVGLSVFLVIAQPSEHSRGKASKEAWAILAVAAVVGVAVMLAAGFHSGGRRRAALFGLAAGVGDAVMAVLTKAFAHDLVPGIGHALRSWTPYGLCAVGIVALLLSQTAYQVGRPTVSLPLITVTDPIVSSALGMTIFGEVIHLHGGRGPLALAAVAVMVVGLVVLTRSSAVLEPERVSGAESSACPR